MEPRLRNWGRWCRVWRAYGAADSFEGRYRSPQHWHPVGAKPDAPDLEDAWEIETATHAIALRYHVLLRLVYEAQFNPRERENTVRHILRRRLKWTLSPDDFIAAHGNACALIVTALEMPLVVRKQRVQDWVKRQLSGHLTVID